jgi:hypothetical protein
MRKAYSEVFLMVPDISTRSAKAGWLSRSLSSGVKANTWVKLLELPSPHSFDKALLLYRFSLKEWIAWVPNYGEIRLNENKFYSLG